MTERRPRRILAGMRRPFRKAKKARPESDDRTRWSGADVEILSVPGEVARYGTSVAYPTPDPKLLRVVDVTGREAVVRRDVLAKMGWPV